MTDPTLTPLRIAAIRAAVDPIYMAMQDRTQLRAGRVPRGQPAASAGARSSSVVSICGHSSLGWCPCAEGGDRPIAVARTKRIQRYGFIRDRSFKRDKSHNYIITYRYI